MSRRALAACWLVTLAFVGGCGYTFQTSRSPLREKEGVENIYIEPIENNSYTPGVENLLYNAAVRAINASRRARIVRDLDEADAVLYGRVSTATSQPGSAIPAERLNPVGTGPSNVFVAVEYIATLGADFRLVKRENRQDGKVLWSSGFSRSRSYPGNNQLGTLGATSQLINQSEFDRVLDELSRVMMEELNESMLAMF